VVRIKGRLKATHLDPIQQCVWQLDDLGRQSLTCILEEQLKLELNARLKKPPFAIATHDSNQGISLPMSNLGCAWQAQSRFFA
jgi:hypothetical protein